MSTAPEVIPTATKMARSFRRVGWGFLLVGLLLCVQPVSALFDPQASVLVEDVPRADLATKLAVAGFVLFFPLLGAFLVCTPQGRLERWLSAFIRSAQNIFLPPRR